MVDDGLLRYLDQKRSPAFGTTTGLRLPRVVHQLRGSGAKIHTEVDVVKEHAAHDIPERIHRKPAYTTRAMGETPPKYGNRKVVPIPSRPLSTWSPPSTYRLPPSSKPTTSTSPMTRHQLAILGAAIKGVAHHNEHAWERLKWEIFDCGNQSHYPAQSFFDSLAEKAVESLSSTDKKALVASWRRTHPHEQDRSDKEILGMFPDLIVQEIVSRARGAAYRTENW